MTSSKAPATLFAGTDFLGYFSTITVDWPWEDNEERLLPIGLDELDAREPTIRRYLVRFTRSPEAVARYSGECRALGVPGDEGREVNVYVRASVEGDSVRRWGASCAKFGTSVHLTAWLEPEELVEVDRQILDAASARGSQHGLFA